MGFESVGLMFMIVPAIIGVVVLLLLFSAVRDLRRGARLRSRGQQTSGEVISAQVHITGRGDNRSSKLVETIEFATDRGQHVRANPLRSDIGALDRTGQSVTVLYDRDRPERMIAPKNGRSLSPLGPLVKIGGGLVMLVFLSGFVWFSQELLGGFPF